MGRTATAAARYWRAVTATQILVVALIVAAFALGWTLRGSAARDPSGDAAAAPPTPPPPPTTEVDDREQALGALDEARRLYAGTLATPGDAETERRLAHAIAEADDWSDRLSGEPGAGGWAEAYEDAVNALVGLHHAMRAAASDGNPDPRAQAAADARVAALERARVALGPERDAR